VLLVQRGQLSCKGLSPLLGHLEANCGAIGGIDQRLDGFEGCSRGRESWLHPREGFCLVRPVKSAPWSLLVNKFAVLNVEEINTDIYKGTPPFPPLNTMTTLQSYLSLFTSDT